MASCKIPVKFLSSSAIFLMSVLNYISYSQTNQDSTLYYYEVITQNKNMKSLNNAFLFFERKAVKDLEAKNPVAAAYALELLAIGQLQSGFYFESEASATKALKLLDADKNVSKTLEARMRVLNQLGMLYRRLDDFDNSNRFYKQALDLNKNLFSRISIVNNIANNYGDQDQYHEAVNYLNQNYEDVIKLSDTLPKATYLDNLGYYQSKIGDPIALKHMEWALEIKKEIKHLPSIFSSYRHLCLYFSDHGDVVRARNYAELAIDISNILNIPEYQRQALELKLNLEKNPAFENYLELNSKINSIKVAQQNKFAAIKYDFQKSESQLQASELEKEKQQKLGWYYLLLASIILLASALLYVVLRSRHKKDNIQQVFKTETRISKRIHDELANDMSDIMNYVENELETSEANKSKLLTTLQDVYVRTRDISTETASIDFINYPESLKYLLIQHNRPDVKIIVNDVHTIDWKSISEHKKLAVYRALQELMVNMKKHSHAHLVSVVFKKAKNRNEIWYTDDGRGCSLREIKQNGLTNAEYRMKEIGGKLTFETSQGNGFKAIISFNN